MRENRAIITQERQKKKKEKRTKKNGKRLPVFCEIFHMRTFFARQFPIRSIKVWFLLIKRNKKRKIIVICLIWILKNKFACFFGFIILVQKLKKHYVIEILSRKVAVCEKACFKLIQSCFCLLNVS